MQSFFLRGSTFNVNLSSDTGISSNFCLEFIVIIVRNYGHETYYTGLISPWEREGSYIVEDITTSS